MFRSMPAVKLGLVVRPDTISLGVFMGKRRVAFLSLRGFGVGVSRPIILSRMMDFYDLDFAVHSFSMAVNEGRFPRSLELCASRVLPEGPPRLDMFGETPVLTIPTDFQFANFFRKNKPLPLPRVGVAANTVLKGINFLLSQFPNEYKSPETGIQLSVILKPVNGILFRIRGDPFGLAASKCHLPQLDCFQFGLLKRTFTVSFSIHMLKTFAEISALYIKHEESDKRIWISRRGVSMIVDGGLLFFKANK